MNTVSVIDQSRNIAPQPVNHAESGVMDRAAAARFEMLRKQAVGRSAHGILQLALQDDFKGKTTVVSSFGAESVVLLHLVAQVDLSTPIIFLNTGKLFGETLRYRDRLQDVLGLTDIRSIAPHPADRANLDPEGNLWTTSTDACCNFRKVVPLRHALAGFDAQITGRKKFQTDARQTMEPVEFFEGRFRFNPLADWTLEELDAYSAKHNLPRHVLVDDGYASIGCMPCTRRLQAGESYRAGRWAGTEKDECGIHIGPAPDIGAILGVEGDGI